MGKGGYILGLLVALILLFLLYKDSFLNPKDQKNSDRQVKSYKQNYAASLKAGKLVFLHNCIACHGEDGRKGVLGAFDLSQSKLTKMQRVQVIINGRNAMPTFKIQLNAAQIDAVANYITLLRN